MSKTKTSGKEAAQPEFVGELMLNGSTTLTAKTREELAEMVNTIPAECSYASGAVGFNSDSGLYCLQIHLTQIKP